ncbi:MAG: hypothetical protein KGL39_32730 [Patescibacteria group bacterium]|nr:hypothetical protein [Patescibacteria group bacterium]
MHAPAPHNARLEAARDVVRSVVLRVLRDYEVKRELRERIANRLVNSELTHRGVKHYLAVLAEDD